MSTPASRAGILDKTYLLQIFEQVDVTLGALNHVRSSLTEQLLFLSLLLPLARLVRHTSPAPKQVYSRFCILFGEPGVSASVVRWAGRATHNQQHASFRSFFFQTSLLLIFPDAFNVIPPIWVVGLVMSDVQLAHDE
jgi:hypothetical protein